MSRGKRHRRTVGNALTGAEEETRHAPRYLERWGSVPPDDPSEMNRLCLRLQELPSEAADKRGDVRQRYLHEPRPGPAPKREEQAA